VRSAASGSGHVRTTAYDVYRRTLLTGAEVKSYSQLRAWPPIRDAALAWLVIGLCWWTLANWLNVWTLALAIPVIGSRYYALFIIGHDGLHRRLFRKRWLNDLFSDVLIFAPIFAITRVNNANHIRHHEMLAMPGDPDRHKYSCLNKAALGPLVTYITGVKSALLAVSNVFLNRGQRTQTSAAPTEVTTQASSKVNKKSYQPRDLAILLVVQGALIGGLTWTFGFWGYPVLWLAPVYIFTFQADNFRTFAEHSHAESDTEADQHRLITFISSPLERMFLAPMNMNYHAVHHLWPSIPYYRLPEVDRLVRERPEARGLEWRTGYLRFLLRYARALPFDCEPTTALADSSGPGHYEPAP
jgi:fatty acid desaturase